LFYVAATPPRGGGDWLVFRCFPEKRAVIDRAYRCRISLGMNRRRFLRIGIGGAVAVVAGCNSKASAFDLEEKTIADLQELMKSGRLTARSIVEKYLSRIDAIDRQGPRLSSI